MHILRGGGIPPFPLRMAPFNNSCSILQVSTPQQFPTRSRRQLSKPPRSSLRCRPQLPLTTVSPSSRAPPLHSTLRSYTCRRMLIEKCTCVTLSIHSTVSFTTIPPPRLLLYQLPIINTPSLSLFTYTGVQVVSQYSSLLAPLSVDAVLKVIDPATATNVDLNNIKLVRKLG